jgi:hypothetical protein
VGRFGEGARLAIELQRRNALRAIHENSDSSENVPDRKLAAGKDGAGGKRELWSRLGVTDRLTRVLSKMILRCWSFCFLLPFPALSRPEPSRESGSRDRATILLTISRVRSLPWWASLSQLLGSDGCRRKRDSKANWCAGAVAA